MSTFKLIRHSTTEKRIWEDEHGGIFLADSSGDKPGHIGTPDETKDGPLLVESTVKRFTLNIDTSVGRWPIKVLVLSRPASVDPLGEVLVGWNVVTFLSDKMHIPMEIKLGRRVFGLVEINQKVLETMALI